MNLGTRIKKARTHAGLTQEQLAARVRQLSDNDRFKQQSLQRIESGAVKSSSYTTLIAEATGVDHMWLSTGKGAMTRSTNTSSYEVREQQQGYPSQSTPAFNPDDHALEIALMRQILEEVDRTIDEEEIKLNHEEKARVITACYYSALRKGITPDQLDSTSIMTAIQAII